MISPSNVPHFPDELLLHIIKVLAGATDGTTALANTCLASRSLHAFAQPFLYRKFVVPHRDLITEQTSTSRRLTRLETFIRTLLRRPDLAALVETLTLAEFQDDDISLDSESSEADLSPFDPVLADMFDKAARNIPESEDENQWQASWRAELRTGNPDAEVALLLTLVPNLRRLDIASAVESLGAYVEPLVRQTLGPQIDYNDGYRHFLGDFLSQRRTPLPFFSRLELLTVRGTEVTKEPAVDGNLDDDGNVDDDERTLTLARCANLMTLPTIKSFTAYRVGEDSCLGMDLDTFRIPLSHILDLKFVDCVVHCGVYRTLMKSCHKLRSLEISFARSDINVGDDFVTSLEGRSETLKHLALVMPSGHGDLELACPYDLRKLHRLRSLEMEAVLLIPGDDADADADAPLHELLPPSLQRLGVRGCHARPGPRIESLVGNVAALPGLELLEIGLPQDDARARGRPAGEEKLLGYLAESRARLLGAGVELSCRRV